MSSAQPSSRKRFGASLLCALLLHAAFMLARPTKPALQATELTLLDVGELAVIEEPEETGGGLPEATEEDPAKAGMPEPPVKAEQPIAPAVVREKAPPLKTIQPPSEPAVEPSEDPISYDEFLTAGLAPDSDTLAVPVRAARANLIRQAGAAARKGVAIKGSGPGAGGGKDHRVQKKFAFGGPIGAFFAEVCSIPKGTSSLRQLGDCPRIASYKADRINISERKFTEGFPGVSDRSEWFAILYQGEFEVRKEGRYGFRLLSDDGSQLYIDDSLVIDNDGTHGPLSMSSSMSLSAGRHRFRVKYFQGPRYTVALQLFVTPPGGYEKLFRPSF